MITIEVKDPQVYGDIEWISVQIHGQSFMLHQIVGFSTALFATADVGIEEDDVSRYAGLSNKLTTLARPRDIR